MTAMTLTCTMVLAAVLGAAGDAPDPEVLIRVPPPGAETSPPEPGLSYGPVEGFVPPRTIVFSVGPEELEADAEAWVAHGVTAFFLDFIAREWSSDIWARDGKPWTIGESDESFQAAKRANAKCAALGAETFLKVSFDNYFEWFNDLMWQQAYHNFRQFAIFARETGCTGLALDIEYVGEQYRFDWDGYTYEGYTKADLANTIRERMTRVAGILYDEFPDMVFLTFPEQGLGLGSIIHTAWFEEAARRNAPGGVHYCTEHTYRDTSIRNVFAYTWALNDLFHRLLTPRAWQYWQDRCSIAIGLWPFGFNYQNVFEPGLTVEQYRQGYAASLMVSQRYNWIYSHNCRELLINRNAGNYTGEEPLQAFLDVVQKKEMVTTAPYPALAADLRAKQLRDYAPELARMPFVGFVGPNDVPRVEVTPAGLWDRDELERSWTLALQYPRGGELNLGQTFGTVVDWMIIGPFPSAEGFAGHRAVFPPEEKLDFSAEYDGVGGPVRWREIHQADGRASVNLAGALGPADHATAYACCYVTSPAERKAQVRIGANDAGKMWVDGTLVYDYPHEGSAILDRDVVNLTLPAGTVPILIKVTNGLLNWGFVFRITDGHGRAMDDLVFSLTPP